MTKARFAAPAPAYRRDVLHRLRGARKVLLNQVNRWDAKALVYHDEDPQVGAFGSRPREEHEYPEIDPEAYLYLADTCSMVARALDALARDAKTRADKLRAAPPRTPEPQVPESPAPQLPEEPV